VAEDAQSNADIRQDERLHLTPATVDFKAVARVSDQVRLTAVRILSVSAGLHVDLAEVPPDWSSKALVAFDSHGGRLYAKAGTLRVTCSFIALYVPGRDPETAEGFPSADDDVEPALHVEATFQLDYHVRDPSKVEPDDTDHFAFANGTFHAWPYWRELAQSATLRMGIAPLVVGVYKIPSVYDPHEG
jgi:hypothetical protein